MADRKLTEVNCSMNGRRIPCNCGGKAADGSTARRPLRGGSRIAAAEPPTGRLLVDPYRACVIQPGANENSGLRAANSRLYGFWGLYFSFKMNFITFRAQRWASAFVTPSGLFREETSVRSWISPGMSTSTWARMR